MVSLLSHTGTYIKISFDSSDWVGQSSSFICIAFIEIGFVAHGLPAAILKWNASIIVQLAIVVFIVFIAWQLHRCKRALTPNWNFQSGGIAPDRKFPIMPTLSLNNEEKTTELDHFKISPLPEFSLTPRQWFPYFTELLNF